MGDVRAPVASAVKRQNALVFTRRVRIGRVQYDRTANTVSFKLARPRKGPLLVTVRSGILAAAAKSDSIAFTAVLD